MWIFISAGVVYLLGVGIVLFMKPTLMFTPDGQWKEFGIGQNQDRYTPFPFWLFCLTWALVSYILIILLTPFVSGSSLRRNTNSINVNGINKFKSINQAELDINYASNGEVDIEDTVELPKGYYVLNKKATKLAGVPKYVYIGNDEP